MRRKITVTTGTRAEYGLLKTILKKIIQNRKLELILIVTGTHMSKKYGTTINEIKKDGIPISYKFEFVPQKDSLYHSTKNLARGIEKFSEIFSQTKPNLNLVLGDRDEMLVSALAAYHLNIPNVHIHGGERSKGGIDEYTRHAITKISNIHFAATRKNRNRIIKMGENPKYVFFTGSPGIDQITDGFITSKNELEKKFKIKFNDKPILLLQHSITTQIKSSKKQIISTLSVLKKLKKTIIAIGPNSDVGNEQIFQQLKKFQKTNQNLIFFENISRRDYLGLLNNCELLIGNSSSGIIEAGYFKIPVIDIGIRQEGRERGKNVIHVNKFKKENIEKAVKRARKMKINNQLRKTKIYGNGKASSLIVQYLEDIKITTEMIEKQIFY